MIVIPEEAVRCLILANVAKKEIPSFIAGLGDKFGNVPVVIAGQYDDMKIVAAAIVHKRVSTTPVLDAGSSHRKNRVKARQLLHKVTSGEALVVAYGSYRIVNKALGAKNKSKIGIKPDAAGIIFFDAKGRVIMADTLPLS